MTEKDVQSPIDLRLMRDAREWERTAMTRPFREEFFDAFAVQLQQGGHPAPRILELGSGPGFLAAWLLARFPTVHMALLDYSAAMHELAEDRLGELAVRASFIQRDFKQADWWLGLGRFDAVISNQAVHELRHKRHATGLHRQVAALLAPGGMYLVCDHYCGSGGMDNASLYMTLDEQRASLEAAGLQTSAVLVKGGRALYHARPAVLS